jgi:prepilin-type N-terminal cleavage/methylation domain-containing protein
MNRKAFSLIELMVSITILSIMVLYLYGSYSSLNISNSLLETESKALKDIQKVKKTIYLDISLALHNSMKIVNLDKDEDFVYMQSSNSIHNRINPYITYVVNDKKLYRLESLQKINRKNIHQAQEFDADMIGQIDSFRMYKSKEVDAYLIDIKFQDKNRILYKVNTLNEY